MVGVVRDCSAGSVCEMTASHQSRLANQVQIKNAVISDSQGIIYSESLKPAKQASLVLSQ